MADHQHILERRSDLLATALSRRIDAIVESLSPPGQQPAFTTQKSKREALLWWQQHWNDDLGKKVKARLDPESLLQLSIMLGQNQQQGVEDANQEG